MLPSLLLALALGAEPYKLLPIWSDSLKVGTVGHLDPEGTFISFKIRQVVDDDDLLMECVASSRDVPFMLRGLNTETAVDGRTIGFPKSQLFIVEKPVSYETVLGAQKTVVSVRALKATEMAKIEADLEAKRKEEAAKERAAKFRTFYSKDKTKSTLAIFLDFKDGKARLEKEDTQIISVPMSELSDDDQKWIRETLRRRAEKKKD